MRLGQLSRKTGTRSANIVSFLSQLGVNVEDSVNSKVDDQHTKMVIERFAPHLNVEEVVTADAILEPQENEIEIQPAPENPQALEPELSTEATTEDRIFDKVAPPVTGPEATSEELPQVIKAAKVELQGLKVLGKIELPQPRKKETEAAAEVKADEPSENIEKKERRRENRQQPPRSSEASPRKNPVVLRREREERAAAEKKKEQARLEKEKRTQFYQQRVKPPAPVRAARLVDEPLSEMHDEAPDEPKTWWGRFIKWLTS